MAAPLLQTKAQIRALLIAWGYSEDLPTRQQPKHLLTIPVDCRSGDDTHASLELGPRNGAGQQLYSLTFRKGA